MHPKFVLRAVILAVLVALATCQECSHEDKEGYIIDVHTSEKNGAVFMSDAKTLTKESCQNACCNLEEDTLDDGSLARCNLAVFHSSSEIQSKSKNCFLVFCPSKNSCHLTRVKGFTSSYVTHTQVPETTDPEVLSNQPPHPKFYRPDSPPINFHKLFRRSNADGKPGSSMGGAAKQAETLLETAKKLVDAEAGSSSSQADKQVALQEGNLLSALAQDALGTMQKRAKAAKKKPKLITTPKISVKTTGKKPQQTTSSSATAPLVKVTTHGPAAKQTTTQSSQTESPKLKMTSPSPKEGTPTSARSAGMQGSTRQLSTPQMPVLTPASTNPAISPLLAKSTSSETTEASTLLPEINSTLPLSTREPTPSPDETSSESTSSISTNSSKDLVPSSPMDFLGENSALNQTNLSAADQQDSEDEDDSSTKSIIASNGALIAALCFGVIFLLAVVVLLGKHWYEAYQRRHYSKVDYLINGMYN